MRDLTPSLRHPVRPAVALLAVTILAGCGTTTHSAPPPAPSTASARPPETTSAPTPRDRVGRATSRQVAGLVRIVAVTGNDGRRENSTGMVRTSNGEVVTNNHAVAGALSVLATVVSTGRTYDARVLATDPGHDVALLRLDGASGLTTVRFARRTAGVGDRVSVVGDANGSTSGFAAATGSVLALGQTLVTQTTATARAERLTGVVLSSCDVVWGESGGPTCDVGGRVLGMTTASVKGARHALDGVYIPTPSLLTTLRALERR